MLHNNIISIFITTRVLYDIIRSSFVLYYNLNPSSQNSHENIELVCQEPTENSPVNRHSTYLNESRSEIYSSNMEIFEDFCNLNAGDCLFDTEMNEEYNEITRSKIKDTKYCSTQDLEIFPIPVKCPKDIFYSDSSSSTTIKKRKISDTPSSTYTDSASIDSVCSETNLFAPNVLENRNKKIRIEESKGHEIDIPGTDIQNNSISISDIPEVSQKEDDLNLKKEKINLNSNTRKKSFSSVIQTHQKSNCERKYKDQGTNSHPVSIATIESTGQTYISNANGESRQVYKEIEYIPTILNNRGNFPLSFEKDNLKSYIIKYTVKGREDQEKEDLNTLLYDVSNNIPTITIINIKQENNFKKIFYHIRNIPKYLTPVFHLNGFIIEENKRVPSKIYDFVYNISLIVLCESVHDVNVTDLIPILKYNTEKNFWRDNYIKRIYKWEYILSKTPQSPKFSDNELLVPDHNETLKNRNKRKKKVSKRIRTFLGNRNYKAKFLNYHSVTQSFNILEMLSMIVVFKSHIKYTESIVNSPNNLKDTLKKICEFRNDFITGKKKILPEESLNDIENEIVLVYEVIYENFNKLSKAIIFSYNMFLRDVGESKI